MAVMDTRKWLQTFVKECEQHTLKSKYAIQCEVLCEPLHKFLPDLNPEELQYHLLQHGLFKSNEWKSIEATINKLDGRNMWKQIEKEFIRLKKIWEGPDVPVFIFPLARPSLLSKKQVTKKNGVAFQEALFLFVTADLDLTEVKALLAHEYNHVCRLRFINQKEEALPLKEFLIVEGLGEYAVKELYGEKYLAPWTNRYQYKEVKNIWEKQFVPSLHITDRDKQLVYIYGKETRGLPKWIGYNIGFQIVDSYAKEYGPFRDQEIYRKTTDEILKGSKFHTEG